MLLTKIVTPKEDTCDMKTVLVFGSFDLLHQGHRDFFRQAKALGDRLIVVVASDETIRAEKQRQPRQPQDERLTTVQEIAEVDQVLLGDDEPTSYRRLSKTDFDVLALGYDQPPGEVAVRRLLASVGKADVTIVRLKPFEPDRFKSSSSGGKGATEV